MPTYRNAHAKLKKWIYDIQYPGNRFEFDIISNDFWSSTIWAIQIQVSFPGVENPKNPRIQPSDEQFWTLYWTVFGSLLNLKKSRRILAMSFFFASHWFGQAITSLFGVRRFELEFSIKLFVKYFRGWFITSCESILGVAEAVVKS